MKNEILEAVKKAVSIVADAPAQEGESYYKNAYHGCGVYRLIVKNRRIVATIHGGYHGSNSLGLERDVWRKAIAEYLNDKVGPGWSDLKGDGSGCSFFLRHEEDAHLLDTLQYDVPAANKPFHHNIEVVPQLTIDELSTEFAEYMIDNNLDEEPNLPQHIASFYFRKYACNDAAREQQLLEYWLTL